jgi:hypothetical protein
MQGIGSTIKQKGLWPVLLIIGGLGLFFFAVVADLLGFGAPGVSSNQISLAVSGLAVALAGVALVANVDQRRIAEWLLVGAGVIAAAFAADLLLVGGLPGFGSKQLMVVAVIFAIVLIGLIPASTSGRAYTDNWRHLFAIDKVKVAQFLSILVQLGLLVFVIGQYELENQAFYHSIMLLTLYGFIIHYFLPLRYRQPFFVLLSLTAIFGVMGLVNGLWLIGIGLGLIAICHLPVAFSIRIALLAAAGVALAAMRGEWLPAPVPPAIWPILGSMFMFRLIVYLYDLKHSKKPATLTSTLAYFFLLPNVVFPLFPVVDFATFRRTYFNEEQHQIFQRGVQWLFWGVFQLVAYRLVNYYVVIAVEDVRNAFDLARYVVSNYLIYIRVSGQFFIIIGILHLFGFGLPRTHDRYFLASSFTDLWRRNNIYWKDFMQKVFYMPAYFKLGKLGTISRLVVATALVLALTWFFHAYQWFWLRGVFLLSAPDMLFWTLLGALVITNTIRESRRGRKRTLGERTLTFRDVLASSFRIAGTFAIISTLWSLWSSPSIADWLALWRVAANPLGIATLALIFLGIMLVLGVTFWIDNLIVGRRKGRKEEPSRVFFRSAAWNSALIAALILIGSPLFYNRIGDQTQAFLADMRTSRLSDRDAKLLQKGYYEDLIGVNQFNSDLWDIYTKRPTDWPVLQDTEAARMTNDFDVMELVPSTRINYHGEPLSINRWGMRDQEYEKVPPLDTYRIALVGPSLVMGSGVADDQVFEAVLEARLNLENDGSFFKRYEILNFGIPGHSALQELYALDSQAMEFQPNAFLFVSHQLEEEIIVRNLVGNILLGVELPYPYLDELAARAGVTAGMTQAEGERLLKPYGDELLDWTYRQTTALARGNGLQPFWILFPTFETEKSPEIIAELKTKAEAAGFIVIDLSHLYDNREPAELTVAEWDLHPNARGHQLLADELYNNLRALGDVFPFNFTN